MCCYPFIIYYYQFIYLLTITGRFEFQYSGGFKTLLLFFLTSRYEDLKEKVMRQVLFQSTKTLFETPT